jgi:hypothetical protein
VLDEVADEPDFATHEERQAFLVNKKKEEEAKAKVAAEAEAKLNPKAAAAAAAAAAKLGAKTGGARGTGTSACGQLQIMFWLCTKNGKYYGSHHVLQPHKAKKFGFELPLPYFPE